MSEPPRVVGTHQIRLMLLKEDGEMLSRTRVAQLVGAKGFPDPFAQLGKANIWLEADVLRWAELAGRPCRPLPPDYMGAVPE